MDTIKFSFTENNFPLEKYDVDSDSYVEDGIGKILNMEIFINEQLINHYIDIIAFLYPPEIVKDTYNPVYRKDFRSCKGKLWMKHSDFYPFSCSCGVAGCAGIWDGIYVKNRKHTVEWRIPENSGYGFLDKKFYSFRKDEYLAEIDRLKQTLKQRPEVLLSDYETCGEVVKRLGL